MTPDERLGVPSASAMERIHHCPSSHKMEKAAEAIVPDTGSKDAAAGELTHGIISGEESDENAPYRAAQTAEMCEAQAEELLNDWRGPASDGELEMIQERRYYLTQFGTVIDKPTGAVVFSGRIDRLHIQGERGILFDWKTLNGEHAAAIENRQLAAYAVLVMTRHKLKSLRVALVQPWKGRPTVCDYDEASLKMAFDMLQADLLRETQATPDDRKAGPWCKFCKANIAARCEVAINAAVAVAEPLNYINIAGLDGDAQRKALFARAMELSPERHIALYQGAAMLKRMHEVITGSFKQRVEAGEIPGYSLREKKGRRSIADVGTVFSRANAHGVTAEDFTAECSLPLGSLNDLLRKATKAKGKALETIAAQCLEGCTDTGKPSFEVVEVETNRLEERA